MVPLAALDCVDRLLRDLTGSTTPFGGNILVVGGDFRQILPVVPRANEAEVVANTILQHYTMRDGTFQKATLTENMRLRMSGGEDATHRGPRKQPTHTCGAASPRRSQSQGGRSRQTKRRTLSSDAALTTTRSGPNLDTETT